MNSKKQIPWLLLAPMLVGIGIFFVIPLVIMVFYSLGDGAENYIKVLQSSAFQLAVWNTIRFLLVGISTILVSSFMLSLWIRRKGKGMSIIRSLLLIPMMMGIATTVLLLRNLFGETAGFWVLIGCYIWKYCGYNIVLFIAGLNLIPQENYDFADVEGASWMQKLRWITLPMMKSSFFFVLIISIINCFKMYREAFLLYGEHPDGSVYMIQHFLNNNFQNLNYGRLSVASILLTAAVTVLALICYKKQKECEEIRL